MQVFAVLLPFAFVLAGPYSAADDGAAVSKGRAPARHARVLRVPANDPLTRQNLAELRARSTTARDVLRWIERLPDAVLIVRAHPLLVREAQLFGRGRFWVVDGRLFGLLEYQAEPRGSARALRVLAHELGHALEIGLGPRARDTRMLREVLLAREEEEVATRSDAGVETEFARLIGLRVHLELRGRLRTDDGLAEAATAARLELPDGVAAPGDGWDPR